jgi:hypothetical protein
MQGGNRGGRKVHCRFLAKAQWLVARAHGRAQTGQIGMQAFDSPHGLKEVEAKRLLLQRPKEIYTIGRCPHRGTQRMISPRLEERSTVSAKELIET